MSHNKNYSRFSRKKENTNLEEFFPEKVIEAETEIIQTKEFSEESQNIEKIIGFVDNCECLRVRKESNVDSEELCIINKLYEVIIDLNNSTDDFYKVKTSDGVEGYCMKKFITIKQKGI